jgi:hypothetical protein
MKGVWKDALFFILFRFIHTAVLTGMILSLSDCYPAWMLLDKVPPIAFKTPLMAA